MKKGWISICFGENGVIEDKQICVKGCGAAKVKFAH